MFQRVLTGYMHYHQRKNKPYYYQKNDPQIKWFYKQCHYYGERYCLQHYH